ncbi:MAG: efflux RND transporter periplasmic adaptor subunit [Lachnospiraceae bacterium]|nr:efflux RND transporter periplasmic adaptor subunit [Lachnospiraceae bacterium]
MSRIDIKKPVAVFLAAALTLAQTMPAIGQSGYPENDELYFAALENEVVENVQTAQVTKGDFIINAACKASIEYDNISYVFNDISTGTVQFAEMLVSAGDTVKVGDPIVKVNVSVDNETVEQLEADIESLEEALDSYINTNVQLLARYDELAKNSASAADRRVAQLLHDRLSVNYNDELQRREDNIEAKKATLSTYRSLQETQYIKASSSGKISNVQRMWRGQNLDNYAFICSIYDTSHVRLRVSNGGDDLSFDQKVYAINPQDGNKLIPGRVVSCISPVLSSNLVGNAKYIELLGDPSTLRINEDVSIRYESVHTQNALLVPKKAVESDLGGDFVYLYQNGHQFKKYFISGGSNAEYYWAVLGLDEGDTVVLH